MPLLYYYVNRYTVIIICDIYYIMTNQLIIIIIQYNPDYKVANVEFKRYRDVLCSRGTKVCVCVGGGVVQPLP